MATIVSSTIDDDRPQFDGRRWIIERHVDNASVARIISYLAAQAADANALLAAHAAQLTLKLSDDEIQENIAEVISVGSLATPSLIYSTAADNFSALRQVYLTATDRQAIMIGDFLSTLTDTQLRNAFNMTLAQVTTLRTNKLTPAATIAAQIRAAMGQ